MPTFKPNDRARRAFRPRPPKRELVSIQIPDCVKRDIILERDKLFCGSVTSLLNSVREGKTSEARLPAMRQWLVMASLRRNHIPLHEANRMLRA